MLKSIVKTLGDRHFWLKSRDEFRALLEQAKPETPESLMRLAHAYRGDGWYRQIGAYQIEWELNRLLQFAHDLRPARVMEIGTKNGGTLLGWCRFATELVVSVDLPGGIHGGGYPAQKQKLYREFVADRPGVQLELLQRDSQSAETYAKVAAILGSKKLDVLFIDGDHRYAGVKRDYELYRPLVREGGYILFHDILPHVRDKDCEVHLLWEELKPKVPTEEWVGDYAQGWAGIGVVRA